MERIKKNVILLLIIRFFFYYYLLFLKKRGMDYIYPLLSVTYPFRVRKPKFDFCGRKDTHVTYKSRHAGKSLSMIITLLQLNCSDFKVNVNRFIN
jgi:hypothetical protein